MHFYCTAVHTEASDGASWILIIVDYLENGIDLSQNERELIRRHAYANTALGWMRWCARSHKLSFYCLHCFIVVIFYGRFRSWTFFCLFHFTGCADVLTIWHFDMRAALVPPSGKQWRIAIYNFLCCPFPPSPPVWDDNNDVDEPYRIYGRGILLF